MFLLKNQARSRAIIRNSIRRGVAIVEFAVVGPVFVLFLIGLIVGGVGVFRYHQVTALAHEAARYATVHGRDYERVTGQPKATSYILLKNVLQTRAAGLDLTHLTCELKWGADESTAIVTVRYQWTPEALWTPVTFSSTATSFVTY